MPLTTASVPLSSTWTNDFAGGGPGAIAAGENGAVWVFSADATQLSAVLLDAQGNTLGQQSLLPPPGLAPLASNDIGRVAEVMGANSHALGPVLSVKWAAGCPNDVYCPTPEVLVFGPSIAAAPVRVVLPDLPQAVPLDGVYRTASGDSLWLNLVPESLRLIDLAGKTLWRRAIPQEVYGAPAVSPGRQEGGAVDLDGTLILNLTILTSAWGQPASPLLLRADAQGNLSLERYLSDVPPSADFTLAAGYGNPVAIDSAGRLSVFSALKNGDLSVTREGPGGVDKLELLREGYSDLFPDAVTVDGAGTLYVSTNSGGRAEVDQKPLLCRIPVTGASSCFAIPSRAFVLQPSAPGVVFALTKLGLSRFDFPAL